MSLCDLKRSPLTPAWPGGAGSEGSVLKQWGTRAVGQAPGWTEFGGRVWTGPLRSSSWALADTEHEQGSPVQQAPQPPGLF